FMQEKNGWKASATMLGTAVQASDRRMKDLIRKLVKKLRNELDTRVCGQTRNYEVNIQGTKLDGTPLADSLIVGLTDEMIGQLDPWLKFKSCYSYASSSSM